MTDLPVIMSAPMVRATMAGRKTVTRRLLQPGALRLICRGCGMTEREWKAGKHDDDACAGDLDWTPIEKPPRWKAGDYLWVRETWAPVSPDEHPRPIEECRIEYRADTDAAAPGGWTAVPKAERPTWARWRPSIFMRRPASRITLHVERVRIERLHAITDDEALREGATSREYTNHPFREQKIGWSMDWSRLGQRSPFGTDGVLTVRDIALDSPRWAFANFWARLHGASAWAANPWVAAISFTAIMRNIDQVER